MINYILTFFNFGVNFQIDRISAIAAKYVGKPVVSYPLLSPSSVPPRPLELGIGGFGGQPGMGGDMYGAGDLLRSISGPTEADKPMIIELAVAAMEELIGMAQMGDPLWLPTLEGGSILNEEEYVRSFPRGIGPKPAGFKCEASRESSVVIMNHVNLVEILMDVVRIHKLYIIKIFSYLT
jgi:homeobox-leucine zipper protein